MKVVGTYPLYWAGAVPWMTVDHQKRTVTKIDVFTMKKLMNMDLDKFNTRDIRIQTRIITKRLTASPKAKRKASGTIPPTPYEKQSKEATPEDRHRTRLLKVRPVSPHITPHIIQNGRKTTTVYKNGTETSVVPR